MTLDEKVSLQLGRLSLELLRGQTALESAQQEIAALQLRIQSLEKALGEEKTRTSKD